MTKKYVMIRMPTNVYTKYWGIKRKMEDDLSKVNNRPVNLSLPQFFDTLVSYNQNWIEIDLERLNTSFIGRGRKRL